MSSYTCTPHELEENVQRTINYLMQQLYIVCMQSCTSDFGLYKLTEWEKRWQRWESERMGGGGVERGRRIEREKERRRERGGGRGEGERERERRRERESVGEREREGERER